MGVEVREITAADVIVVTRAVRRALNDAMFAQDHTQKQCVSRLEEYGADVGQQAVSAWLNGRTQRLEQPNAEAVARYLTAAGIRSLAPYADAESGRAIHDGSQGALPAERDPATVDTDGQSSGEGASHVPSHVPSGGYEFVEAGEPELTGRRARLVDAYLGRVERADGPVNEHDAAVAKWLSEVLRLPPPNGSSPPDGAVG